jgi:hypothetical protein
VHGYDADSDPLIYKAGQAINGGTVVIDTAGNFVYTPGSAFVSSGSIDRFDVTVSEANAAAHVHGLMGLFKSGYGSTATTSVAVARPAPPPPPPPPPPSSQTSSVPATGDTTAALQAILDKLKPGDTLTLDKRTYQQSGVLQVRVAGVHIVGNGATLQATNDATSSFQILADNVSVENLTLTAPLQGARYENLEQQRLVIRGNGDTLTDVTVNGSAAAGVLIWGASNFTLTRVHVSNTRADGIHMSNGANHGTLNNCVVTASGDDGVAVVSYGNQPISHDIVINSPTVNGTTGGRGISVVGGQNIAYNNITVNNSNAAAVYIADEGDPWYTSSVNHVTVTGGTITGANTNAGTGHGAVLVYSGNGGQGVNDVTISGLTIASTTPSAPRNVGIVIDAGSVSGIVFKNIALQNTGLTPLALYRVPAGTYTTSGWTLNGNPITAM